MKVGHSQSCLRGNFEPKLVPNDLDEVHAQQTDFDLSGFPISYPCTFLVYVSSHLGHHHYLGQVLQMLAFTALIIYFLGFQ